MGRHHHRISYALTLLAWGVLGTPAHAQPSDEPGAAQASFDEGVVHLREERFEEAAQAFRAAYRETPRVEAMCNLALTYDRWGDHIDRALSAYRTCARDDETGRYRGFAERRVAELERAMALTAAPPPEPEPEVEDPSSGPEATPYVYPRPEPVTEAPPVDHTLLALGVSVGTIGAVSLGVAIGLAVESNGIVDALTEELGSSPTVVRGSPQYQRLADAQLYADVAIGMYVASAGLLAASTLLILADWALVDGRDGREVRLGLGGPGLALHGVF